MNWLVIMNVHTGFATHARTPVRSACTRKPVTSGQESLVEPQDDHPASRARGQRGHGTGQRRRPCPGRY